MECICKAVGRGAQTFRIRNLAEHFETVAELGELAGQMIKDRKRLSCRHCAQGFVLMQILFDRGEEEIIVKVEKNSQNEVDWKELADLASNCRWRGAELDSRYLI